MKLETIEFIKRQQKLVVQLDHHVKLMKERLFHVKNCCDHMWPDGTWAVKEIGAYTGECEICGKRMYRKDRTDRKDVLSEA
jgi:hypothetical protein